ncbi:MAG TPA: hypothetical protein VHT70_02380 [Candidatus Saccharimonadales bacterium]|jgi:hypothetical protein|nr:hypothetical protein [Candidatus Saccharimonadales bacterium]
MPEDNQLEKPNTGSSSSGGKTFDVTPPGKSPAAPTSKPVILGHGPMAGDPMMADPDTKLDTEGTPKAGVPISVLTKKLKIEPIHPDLVPDEQNGQPAEVPPALPVSSEVSQEMSDQPVEPPAEPSAESTPVASSEPASLTSPATQPEADASDQPTTSPTTEAPTTPTEPVTPPPEAADASTPSATPAVVTGPTQKEQDKAAEKAAAEVAEKLAGYEKVIDSKQYFVPVNSVRKRSMRLLVIGAVLVIVAALVCIDFMLDAGTLTLPFNVPHTHIIKQ